MVSADARLVPRSPRRLTAALPAGYRAWSMPRPPLAADASDEALVAALAAGDERAMAALYARYAPLLHAVGLRVLGHPREAEDLLHDVFLEAWRSAGQFDPARGTVRAWLVTRMRSRALDRRRSAGWSRGVGLDHGGPEPAAPPVDPGAGAEGARLRGAVLGLPPEQRAVLELAYFDGLSSTEIAERLGVPVGTVKSRTAAAMARLRAALREG